MPKLQQTRITEVPNYQALQKCRQLVFNRYQVDLYGITGSARDTEFSYILFTDGKITKPTLASVQAYINGVVDTLKSF